MGPKEEKAFLAQCKPMFDEAALGMAFAGRIVAVLDKMGSSGQFYADFLAINRVVQWGAPGCGAAGAANTAANVTNAATNVTNVI